MSKKSHKIDVVDETNAKEEEASANPQQIFLRDTIIKMQEFEKYGLNQYFLRAILKDDCYTLDTAHNLIKDFIDKH